MKSHTDLRSPALAAVMLATSPAWADNPTAIPPPTTALWTGATVPVRTGDFQIQAYDSARGLISVSLPAELPAGAFGPPRYRVKSRVPVLVPVSPGLLGEVFEAERNGRVELDVSLEPLPMAETVGPDRPDPLVDARPTWIRLNIERNTVAEGAIGASAEVVRAAPLSVGPPRRESRPLSNQARSDMEVATLRVAQRCARQAEAYVPSVRGALQMEVERSAVGQRLPVRVAVDVTLCNRLVECLTDGLAREDQLWSALEDGDKVWLPIYFKGTPDPEPDAEPGSEGGSGPAVSGAFRP